MISGRGYYMPQSTFHRIINDVINREPDPAWPGLLHNIHKAWDVPQPAGTHVNW